ncbi:MAG: type III secretion chaperone [Candidatus Rhabdochlamydia sp.]
MSSIEWTDILGWNEEAIEDLRGLGYAYLKQGKYSIAASLFEAILTLKHHTNYDLQTLGALYLEMGKNFQALDMIERALKMDPYHAETLLNRVKALFALGFRRQAATQAQALSQDASSLIADQASALLLAYT